jgi:ATP-dependent RNA helicase RhlE
MQFSQLNIIEPILKAVAEIGYETPTPIQEKAIPLLLQGKDLIGCAQTGTGKTAAFAIPVIQSIEKSISNNSKPFIQSLIVTPTRELAIQIDESIGDYAKYTRIKHTVIFGGVGQNKQVESLKRGVHILVATPGRLLDLIGQGFIDLSSINIFVLDEADRMLDMGFINDIKKIIKLLPNQRQSLFFSATMPKSIEQLAKTIVHDPIKISVTPESTTAETVQQSLYYTNKSEKRQLLTHIIREHDMDQVLVFSRTKHGADRIVRDLNKQKIKSAAIHGDKAQNNRQKVLNHFKEGKLTVLVATDIASRGIDIDKLKYVINFDIPNEPETYVHRIGRSGRAGESGHAISISEPEENDYVKDIQKLINQKIKVVENHPFPQTDKPMTEAEKKEWQKEKQRRKNEYFANRDKSKHGGRNNHASHKTKSKSENKPVEKSSPTEGRKRNSRNTNEQRSSSDRKRSPRKTTDMPASLKGNYRWPLEK